MTNVSSNYASNKKLDSIILVGPPGAGKGTHAKKLVEDFPDMFYHISTGEEFRKIAKTDKDMEALLSTEKYVSDDNVMTVLDKVIKNYIDDGSYKPNTQYLILDGVPRTIEQAKMLDNKINVKMALHIWVPDYQAIFRMMNRKDARPQDKSIEECKKRLKIYHEKTEPLIYYYDEKILAKVDNLESKTTAYNKILKNLIKITTNDSDALRKKIHRNYI